MPVPILDGTMNTWGPSLQLYLQEVEDRLGLLEAPQSPKAIFACLKADLPDAATYINAPAYVTDTKILAVSDGTVWRRQDTGAPI